MGEVNMGEWWMWTGFFSIVLVLLWIDIRFVGGGKSHKVSLKEAGVWSLILGSGALLFHLALLLWRCLFYTSSAAAEEVIGLVVGVG